MHSACGQFWEPRFIAGGVNHQYNSGYYGGGVSMADFDMDGWDDVFLCSRGEDPLLLKSVDGVWERRKHTRAAASRFRNFSGQFGVVWPQLG